MAIFYNRQRKSYRYKKANIKFCILLDTEILLVNIDKGQL
jgi:hypothetical protein